MNRGPPLAKAQAAVSSVPETPRAFSALRKSASRNLARSQGLEGAVRSSNQPAESQGDGDARIWSIFDVVTNGIFCGTRELGYGVNCISGGIFGLPIQILCASFGLLHLAPNLRLGVARCTAKTFFDFSAQILRCSAQPIFIHSDLSRQQLRYTFASALTAPASDPDQNSHAYGDSKGNQRAVFNLHGNPVKGVVADFPSEFYCLIAETRRLLRRNAPTNT
jgi:hypothetical protein